MRRQSKRRVSLLLTLIMLLSMPAIGLAEPTVTVEPQPTDLSGELTTFNASPTLLPSDDGGHGDEGGTTGSTSESGGEEGKSVQNEPFADDTTETTNPPAPQVPATLTLVPNATLPTTLPLDGQGSGILGRISIQESFPSLEGISWRLSAVNGDAVTLAAQPVSGSPSADIAYSKLLAAGEVTYDLTCALAGVTGSLRITLRVTDSRPTSIAMPQAVYNAVAGIAATLPTPTPLPEGSAFPQGTEFFAELQDGSKVSLSELSFAEEGEFPINVVAKFGETSLKMPVTITVTMEELAQVTSQEPAPDLLSAQANNVYAVNPTRVTVSPTSTTVQIGKTVQLRSSVSPYSAEPTVVWTSADDGIASVDESGKVTGVGVGTVVISATSTVIPTLSGTCKVTVTPIPVTSIKITSPGDQKTLAVNSELSLSVEVLPVNATNQEVQWSSSSPSVISVDESGNVRALKKGTATITAAAKDGQSSGYRGGSVRGTIALTAFDPATDLSITSSISGLMIGKTASVKATITPSTASQKVTWTSSDPSIVSVTSGSTTSTLRALLAGTVTITATTADGTDLSESFQVSVNPGVTSITITADGVPISSASIDLAGSNTLQLGAIVEPNTASQTVAWSIGSSYYSSSSVATVDPVTGLVTGVNAGSTTITAKATDGSGKSVSIPLKVERWPESVDISAAGGVSSLTYGQYVQLTATVLPTTATDKTVIWSSSDENAATVSAGRVTAKRVTVMTSVNITATTKAGGKTASYTISVYPIPSSVVITVNGVEQSTASLDMTNSATLQLSARVTPEDANQEVTWSSSGYGISVDSSGTVTASRAGTATIRAVAKGTTSVSKTITVTAGYPIETITVDGPTELASSKSARYTATVSPSTATTKAVTWSVDIPSIATINASTGQLTAIAGKYGDIVVKATAKDGSGIEGTLNVRITPIATSMKIYADGSEKATAIMDLANNMTTLQLTAVITPDNAGQGVTWSSSRPTVAKVDAKTGYVTAEGITGSTVITATATDGSLVKKTITINVCRAAQSVTIKSKDNVTTLPSRMKLPVWAEILPDNATIKTLKWSSSNPSIATVSATSTLSSGTATITAGSVTETKTVEIYAETTDGSDIKAVFYLTVTPLATSVEISGPGGVQPTYGLDIGGSDRTMQLYATILPGGADQKVTWSSTAPAIAYVDQNGLVKGGTTGRATITATAADGSLRKASVVVNVAVMTTNITFLNTETELLGTKTLQLRVDVLPLQASKTFTWSSSDVAAATVSTGGLVTAKAVTEVKEVLFTCKATDGSGTYAEYTLTIKPNPTTLRILADGVAITALTVDFAEVERQLTAVITPGNANQEVAWSSNNTGVLSVDPSGILTIHKLGTATITATSQTNNALRASVIVTVQKWANTITISSKENVSKIAIAQSLPLTAKLIPDDTTTTSVTWTVDDPTVASVSSSGLLTANVYGKAVGVTTVTATAKDKIGGGVSGTFIVTVTPKATSVVIASAGGDTIDLASEPLVDTLQLSAVVNSTAPVSQAVTWTSSNLTIAKVDTNGLVQGMKVGSAIITATAKDGSNVRGTFTVYVKAQPSEIVISGKDQLLPGGTAPLTASVLPAAVVNKSVKWSTIDTDYITVSSSGVVTARTTPLNGGTWPQTVIVTATSMADTTIIGTYEIYIASRAATAEIWVDGSPATAVSMLSNDGAGITLDLIVSDVAKSFTWKSSVPALVKVTSTSISTALVEITNPLIGSAGRSTITATATDGSGLSATITVVVINHEKQVAEFYINTPTSTTLSSGKNLQLATTMLPANAADKTVAWSSSNSAVASVSSGGLVTAKPVLGDTEVTITAKALGAIPNITSSITLTIKPSASNLTISTEGQAPIIDLNTLPPDSPSLALSAICTPSGSGGTITWESSNSSVARVTVTGDSTCMVTGLAVGTATITATAADNTTAKDTITISVKRLIRGITISGPTEVAVGNTITLSPILTPVSITSKDVVWSLDENDVVKQNAYVSIAQSGSNVIVKGLSEGTSIPIYCKPLEGIAAMATYAINVLPKTTKLTIESGGVDTINLNDTSTLQLGVSLTPSTATPEVLWTSLSPSIATVDQTGKVTALNPGKVTIRASTKDGTNLSDTIMLSIIRAATSVTVRSNNGLTKITAGGSLALTATVLPINATDKTLMWMHDGDGANIKITTVNGAVTVTTNSATAYTESLTITATNPITGASGTFTMTVLPRAQELDVYVDGTDLYVVSPITINLNDPSRSRMLTAEVLPFGAMQSVSWSSSLPSVAKVESIGTGQAVLTGLAVGQTYITITVPDGSGTQVSFPVKVVRQ